MDSLAQAAAYLQPSLEFAAKLSSIIPMWMMMVMVDKHLLGLPLLGGSVWHSPRIPPRLTIGSSRSGEHASGSKFGRHSTPSGPSPLERGSFDSTIPYPRPFQALRFFSGSQPQGASSTTALTIYQPLEVHDPIVSSSGWLEPGCVGSAVLLVVMISFVAMITSGRCYLFGKNQATQARSTSNTDTPQQSTEEMEFPICWESILEDLLSNHSDETLEDSLDEPSTPMRANEDEYFSPQDMTADNAEKVRNDMELKDVKDETLEDSLNQPSTPLETNEDEELSPPKIITDTAEKAKEDLGLNNEKAEKAEELLEENEKSDQTETVSKMEREQKNPEEEIPEIKKQDMGKGEKIETKEVDATHTGPNFAEFGNKNGSKAGKGDHEEDRKEQSKVNIKEAGPSESANNEGNEDLEISAMEEGIKKKKRRVRQNAKKRAAKLAAAEEAEKDVGESSNASLEDAKQREEKDGKSKEVETKVVQPEASHELTTTKGQKEVEATTKDTQITEDTIIAKNTTSTGKGGGYSFKETDLHDATFVAAGTTKKTSLPPRPPTPQSTNKPVPVDLPSKPQFTGLPTPKSSSTPQPSPATTANSSPGSDLLLSLLKGPTRPSSGTPQPSPVANANSSPGSDLLSSLITPPRGIVPPLMPHHQSFGEEQSSSNGPSGQFSTPFQHIPGLDIPKTTPALNPAPFKSGAINPSPDGLKPLFGSLNAQGGPKAGTDSHSTKPYLSGNGYPSPPVFGNLPSGPPSNDAFKLPAIGPSAGFGKSDAGPARTAPTNQSIFQNMPTSSGQFTGFDSSSAGPAETAPTNRSIFQNVSLSSGQFTGFGQSSDKSAKMTPPTSSGLFAGFNSSSAGPDKSAPTSQSIFQNVPTKSGPFVGFGSSSTDPVKPAPAPQSIFQNVPTKSGPFVGFGSSSPGPENNAPSNQSIFQNTPTSSGPFNGFGSSSSGPAKTTQSGQFTGFGTPSAGPAKTNPTSQSIFQNMPTSSGPFIGFGSTNAGLAKTAPISQSIFQNVPTSSGPFIGFGSSSTSPKVAPASQSIFENVPISSGQFTGFGSPSAATTNPPLQHPGSMFQKIAQPPTPLSLGINQQHGIMPLQNAVMGAMNLAAGNKMEGTKPAPGPGALPFKSRSMPKGRLGIIET